MILDSVKVTYPNTVLAIYKPDSYYSGSIYLEKSDVDAKGVMTGFKPLTKKELQNIHRVFKNDAKKNKDTDIKRYFFSNLVDYDVLHFTSNPLTEQFSITWRIPSAERMFVLKKEPGMLKYPNLIFQMKRGRIFAWAYKVWKGNNTILYNMPFPNFYSENSMCWGNINFNFKERDFSKIMEEAEKAVFQSSFNAYESRNRTKKSTPAILKKARDTNKPIPTKMYVPSKKKLKDVIS